MIISTGAQSLMLGVDREGELIGHGVSTCATCDGFFFRDHDIAVVGGGDSALEEAIFLTKFARSVTVIHRRDELRASKIMQERAFANEKIRFLWNHVVEAVDGRHARWSGVTVRNVLTDERQRAAGDRPVRGHRPQAQHRPVQGPARDGGVGLPRHRARPSGATTTNVEGVFACGDVQDHTYRQAITAAGSGCEAAIDAERWLEAQHD